MSTRALGLPTSAPAAPLAAASELLREALGSEGTRRLGLLTCAGAFSLLAGITALKAVASGLFLAVAGASALPAATIVVSVAVALAGRAIARRGGGVPVRRLLRCVMGFAALALVALGLSLSFREPGRAVAILLMLTCAIAGTLGVALAWTTFRHAMPGMRGGLVLGGTFALLGGAFGSQATIVAVPRLGVGGMVIACAVLLLAGTACLDACLVARGDGAAPDLAPSGSLEPAAQPPASIVRSVVLLAFLVVFCSTLAEFQFASAAASMRQGPEALAAFISSWQLVVSLAAIPVHLALSPLLRRDRLPGALLVAPAIMLAAGAAMIVLPGVVAALALKATDGTIRHSFHKGVLEACLIALPESARVQVRLIADTFVDRSAQVVASGMAWGLTQGLGLGPRGLAVITAMAALAWLVAALHLGSRLLRDSP